LRKTIAHKYVGNLISDGQTAALKQPLEALDNPSSKATKVRKVLDNQPHSNDPLSRLTALLPALERLVRSNETPIERMERETKAALQRMHDYVDSFTSFTHPDDPIFHDSTENRVYCKQCHFYLISHTVSKKGGRFYVNDHQPCSFPLTGRGYHKYEKGAGRKEFIDAHRCKSGSYSKSE